LTLFTAQHSSNFYSCYTTPRQDWEETMKQAELFNVKDHVAIVTGAASGIGLAYAEVMAENGATVVMAGHNEEALNRHAARLNGMGCKVEAVSLDVVDTDALRALIDGAVERHQRLDALFCNVGIGGGRGFLVDPSGGIEQFDVKAYQRSIDVNITSTLMAMRFAVPHMKRRRSGSIVATSSIAGIRAEPITSYSYVASKAAINNIVRQAAVELAPHNIRINAIVPGPFFTNIGGGRLHRDKEVVKLFEDLVPMGRVANTDEIKGLALLLASPAGSYLTGACIPIDGGATAVMTRGSYSTAVPRDGANA
jgi:NAD(P)-dependent dehydrogenase (short-subunit alcohol dehydrogenase family)